MFDPAVAAIFPLPLTTFEKYMLWDDRDDCPMTFAFQLRLSGEIDRADFESALESVLPVHPLLCALVKRLGRGSPAWTLAERLRPTIDWGVLGAVAKSPRGERIDLRFETGLRVWIRQGGGVAEVMLQFHHACCDALGALRFIGDLLAAYGRRATSTDGCLASAPTHPHCEPADLLRRGRFVVPKAANGNRIRTLWNGIVDGVRFLKRRPAMLLPNAAAPDLQSVPATRNNPASQEGPTARPFLEIHRQAFDRPETQRLRQLAKSLGVTVNDLLLRDMFQTLQQWDAGQASKSLKPWLRIAVPVNLKNGKHDRTSAANGVSYTFVTRHRDECAPSPDPHALVQGIHRETDAVTRSRRAVMFLRGFRSMECIPGAIRLYMRSSRCFATVVLSNLGEIGRQFGTQCVSEAGKIVAGNLILEDIFAAPPVRPNTPAAFMAGTYDERLWVSLRADLRVFTADDASRLLSLYVDRIRQTVSADRH